MAALSRVVALHSSTSAWKSPYIALTKADYHTCTRLLLHIIPGTLLCTLGFRKDNLAICVWEPDYTNTIRTRNPPRGKWIARRRRPCHSVRPFGSGTICRHSCHAMRVPRPTLPKLQTQVMIQLRQRKISLLGICGCKETSQGRVRIPEVEGVDLVAL